MPAKSKATRLQARNSDEKSYAFAIAMLFALATLWSLSYTLTKIAVVTIPPITLTAVRATIAGLLLLLVMRLQGAKLPRDPKLRGQLMRQSFLNSIIPFTLIAWAQSTVDVNIGVILSSTSPIFTFFLTWAITRHEPATARKLFGVVAGLTGICLIVGAGALSGIGKDLLAQFALLAAAFSYSCAAIFGRSFDGLDPIVPSAFTVMFASIVLVPVSLVVDRPWTISPSAASLAALAALSVFSTALAYVIYFWLLKTLGSIGVTSQSYLRIPIGVFFGVVFLGETLLTSTWIGLACVLVGVVAMTLPSGRQRKRKAEPVAPD
jgi:drug/metabolite transporter (DMT)-like permease